MQLQVYTDNQNASAMLGTRNCTTATTPKLQNNTNKNEIESSQSFYFPGVFGDLSSSRGGGGGTIFGSEAIRAIRYCNCTSNQLLTNRLNVY
eukprot:4640419-Amphidinium_carterae.1